MPDFALIALDKLIKMNINVVAVVPPAKNEATYPLMKQFVSNLDLKLIEYEQSLKENLFLSKIKAAQPDMMVVCSYNKKFPMEFINLAKDGVVNCHPSLLPFYRGGNPYSHVIINNEKFTGVTLHYMDENFDTGDVICQYKIKIDPIETMGTLFNKLSHIGANLLCEMIQKYEIYGRPAAKKQPQGNFIKAKDINPQLGDNIIDWNIDAFYIERFVRALNPFISAITTFRGILIKINTAYAKNKNSKYPPGTICEIGRHHIAVSTLKGILIIKSCQLGSYLTCDAEDFIKRFKPRKGEQFGI